MDHLGTVWILFVALGSWDAARRWLNLQGRKQDQGAVDQAELKLATAALADTMARVAHLEERIERLGAPAARSRMVLGGVR